MKLISQVFVWNNASKNCCVGYAIAAINWAVGQLLVIVFHSIAFHNRFEIVLPATLNITENLQSKIWIFLHGLKKECRNCFWTTQCMICIIIINYPLLKPQPHEGELTGWIVDELRIRLILGEQRTFSCPFATGGKSHRNRRRSRRRPMTTRAGF